MKKRLLFAGFLLPMAIASAQPAFEWLRVPEISIEMNADYIGYNAACDPSGNVFFSGYQSNETPYGAEVLGSVFVKKYDLQGSEIYSHTFNGQASIYAMASDAEGNLLLAIGYRESIIVGNLGFLTSNQGIQPLLVKLDVNGNLMWHYTPAMEESFIEHFSALTVDAANDIYIGYGNYNDSYIQKLTASGEVVSTIVQTGVKTVTSLSVDNQGNVYSAGSCAETNANFNGTDAPIALNYNVYIAKYNAAGVFQWVRYVEDITCPSPLVKARTPDEVYFSSALYEAFSFGSINAEGPTTGFEDFFVAKLDSAGTFQWVREVPGNGEAGLGNRNTLEVDASGNVYFAGRTRGNVAWNDSQTTQTLGFHPDALVLKYSPQGDVLLAKTIAGAAENRFDAVSVNAQGDIYLGGLSYGAISAGSLSHDEGEDRFAFLTKISGASLGTPQYEQPDIVLYPNPASDYIRLSGNFSGNNATLWNALGQKIKTADLSASKEIPLNGLSQGVYFLKADGMPTKQFFKL